MPHNLLNKSKFLIDEIREDTHDVITLFLAPTEKELNYKAGQYVLVTLEDNPSSHGKMYTISSAPSEERVSLSIKKVGKFSGALHDLQVGDAAYISGPFGHFYPTPDMQHVVFFAAGIGITPFLSVLKDAADKETTTRMTLFYSNKTLRDISFFDEITKLGEKLSSLTIHHYLTRDTTPHERVTAHERIEVAKIQDKLGDVCANNYYLCGAISFVGDLRKQLLAHGVAEENIFTESFY